MNAEAQALMLREEEPILTLAELKAKVNLVALVMRDVMKKDTHYGIIPGTPKPSLYKAGAEKLSMTFGIATSTEILEERMTELEVTYVVRTTATSQHSGRFLGAKIGVCSTEEEKYRWRKPVGQEYDETPEDRRRNKWKKSANGTYQEKQVRQDLGSVRNTILQMADKRATVAVIRQVTAASDIFTQDVEDLPEEARGAAEEGAPIQQPQRASQAASGPTPIDTVTAPVAAAAAASQPTDGEDNPIPAHTVIAVKKAKEGSNAKGPWTLWIVKTDGGEFSTFSSSISGAAEKARQEGKKVFIVSQPGDEGRAPTIAELQVAR